MAAMAVLAVAFVVLAAVPVALTDSDAATTVDATKITSDSPTLTSSTVYYYEGTTATFASTASVTSTTIVLSAGASVKIGADLTATVYIGTFTPSSDGSTTGKVSYDESTKIQVEGYGSGNVVATTQGSTTYTVTQGDSLTVEEGVKVKIDSVISLYPLAKFESTSGLTHDGDYVKIYFPGVTAGTTPAQKIKDKEIGNGTVKIKLNLSQRVGAAGSNGTTVTLINPTNASNQFTIADSDLWSGRVEITSTTETTLKGSSSLPDTTSNEGMYLPGFVLTADTVEASTDGALTASTQAYIKAGTSISGETTFTGGTHTVVFSAGTKIVDDIGLLYTSTTSITVSTVPVANTDRPAWTDGSMTLSGTILFGNTSAGQIVMGGATSPVIKDDVTLKAYGDITVSSAAGTNVSYLTVGVAENGKSYLQLCDDVDVGVVVLIDGGLKVSSGVKATAEIRNATGDDSDEIILQGLKGATASDGLGFAIDNSYAITGPGYVEGKLTMNESGSIAVSASFYNFEIAASGTLSQTAGELKFKGTAEVKGEIEAVRAVFLSEVNVAAGGVIESSGTVVIGVNSIVTLNSSTGPTYAKIQNKSGAVHYLDVLGQIKGTGQIIGSDSNGLKYSMGPEGKITATIVSTGTPAASSGYEAYYEVPSSFTTFAAIMNAIESVKLEQGYERFFIGHTAGISVTSSASFPEDVTIYMGTSSSGTAIGTAEAIALDGTSAYTVTVPSSTKLYLKDNAIVVGAKATLLVEGSLRTTGVDASITGAGTFELASGGTVQSTIEVQTAKATGYIADAHLYGTTSGNLSFPLYQKVIIDEGQTFTISALNTVIVSGTFQVLGTLIIEDEGSLILGSLLATANQGATVTVPGSIIVKNGGSLLLKNGSMTVDGSMTVSGEVLVQGNNVNSTTLTIKGQTTVEPTGVLATAKLTASPYTACGTVAVSSTGILNLNGYMGSATYINGNYDFEALNIKNSGSVVIDNSSITARSAGYAATIAIASVDAEVTIDSMLIETGSSNQLTVTDAGLQVGKDTNKYVVNSGTAPSGYVYGNTVNSFSVKGNAVGDKITGQIVISEIVTSETEDSETTYTNIMAISGSATNASPLDSGATELATGDDLVLTFTSATATVTADSTHEMVGYIQIPADSTFVVGRNIAITNTGYLDVSGYLDLTASKVVKITNTSAIIDVSGEIKMNFVAIDGGTVNAAKFSVKEGTSTSAITYNVYSTLNQAVVDITDESNTNTDKTISILGKVTILEDVTVPKDVKVTFATKNAQTSTMTIGSSDDNSVLMTVAQGGSLESGSGQVIVIGTLKFDDKTNDSTRNTVADVTISDSADNGSKTYTNIYNALANAKSGETVNVTKSATPSVGDGTQYVELYSSITIGEGVTLVVGTNAAQLRLADGVTLYVNGTLKTEKDIVAEHKFSTVAKDSSVNNEYTSAIVVAGQIQKSGSSAFTYGNASTASATSMAAGAPIYGAYYTIEGYSVISSLAIAQDNIAKITGSTITINGPVTAGDLSFAKTSSTAVKTIQVSGTQVAQPSSVSTSKVSSSLTVTSLTIDEVTLAVALNGTFTGTVQNDSAAIEMSKIGTNDSTNGFKIYDKDGELTIVNKAQVSKTSSMSVVKGTVYAGDTAQFEFVQKDSDAASVALKVASGATLDSVNAKFAYIDVAGTLVAETGETLEATTIVVSGTVDIFAGDDTSAQANASVGTVYIGTTAYGVSTTGAAAVFNGPVTASGAIVIAAGSDVDSDALKSFGNKKTEYYVEDSLWITVYDKTSGNTVKISKYDNVSITNGYFSGWNDSYGCSVGTTVVGTTGYDKVYAGATYEIYQIIIKADQGIGDLYLGGNIMSKGFIQGTIGEQETQYYAYWATVKAGTYEVTCKLANGYSGTAVLKDADGKDLSGNKLTVSGNENNQPLITSNYQLTGIEKSGYVDPVEPSDDNNDLTVTDYLLIVLVILVVVLAVIVALRLMRS